MSRSREVEVLILDINPSLGKQFNAAKDSLILHVQQKLVQMPSKSEIGMVIIGTPESTNNLAQTKGGYENICEIREISAVDVALMKTVNSLQLGIDAGDWLDAVVVAMDMIIRHCEKKKYEKKKKHLSQEPGYQGPFLHHTGGAGGGWRDPSRPRQRP